MFKRTYFEYKSKQMLYILTIVLQVLIKTKSA